MANKFMMSVKIIYKHVEITSVYEACMISYNL